MDYNDDMKTTYASKKMCLGINYTLYILYYNVRYNQIEDSSYSTFVFIFLLDFY